MSPDLPRSPKTGHGARLLIAAPFVVATLAVLLLAVVPVEHLVGAAAALGSHRGGSAPPADLVEGLRLRAALALLPLGLLAGVCLVRGPGLAAELGAAARVELPRLLRPLASVRVAAPLAGLTVLLAARLAAGMGTPMRTDEAASFLNHGEASPLAVLSVWKNTNNHLLHSLLLRGSVGLFGGSNAAIRLPAATAVALCVPALFLAARGVLRVWPALAVAALFAGSAYAVELGTNARGHPLVLLAACLLFATLPRLARRSPGSVASAAVVAAAGAWAVPLMLLPFAAAVVAVAAWPGRRGWRTRTQVAATLALATGSLVFLLYLPPLLVRGLGESAVVLVNAEAAAPFPAAERFGTLVHNLGIAWQQMAFPLNDVGRGLLLGWIGIGLVFCLAVGGRRRALTLGVVAGPVAVILALGVTPLPWWALSSAFPVLLLWAVAPADAALRRLGFGVAAIRRRPAAAVLLVAAAALPAFAALSADATRTFPRRVGYADAEAAAAVVAPLLLASEPDRLRFLPGLVRAPVLAVALRRLGAGATVPRAFGGEAAANTDRLLTIRDGGNLPPDAEAWLGEEPAFELRRWPLEHSEVLLYGRDALD